MPPIAAEYLDKIEAMHRQVDGLAAPLVEALAGRLVCGPGCSSCCLDGLTVMEVEAELIRNRCADLLQTERPAPEGGCAFLDAAGSCRIYRWRPYVCRTQGLPLRWFEDEHQAVELRDICPLNEDVIKEMGEELVNFPQDMCWTLGPWEGKLASLQAEASGRFHPQRIPLRSLFG